MAIVTVKNLFDTPFPGGYAEIIQFDNIEKTPAGNPSVLIFFFARCISVHALIKMYSSYLYRRPSIRNFNYMMFMYVAYDILNNM